ncbi:MAG TPA: ABC transporter permease [Gammaproteobacteria bacterium]|nr:ABC transporter permease [Gammaproteobacteria bacterium]
MPFKIEILWTDAVFFLLLTCILLLIFLQKKQIKQAPWTQVFKNQVGMSSAVILFFYLLIAFLDSLHFRSELSQRLPNQDTLYATQVESVLDLLLSPLDVQMETTYAAPFATASFAQEMHLEQGEIVYGYEPLTYTAEHIPPNTPTAVEIRHIIIAALPMTGLLTAVSLAVIFFLITLGSPTRVKALFFRILKPAQRGVCWRTFIISWVVMIFLCTTLYYLSRHYHIFGTDKIGQDVFYQAVKSIRTGVMIGTLTTLVMLPFALLMGTLAGYFRGVIDDVIQYTYMTLSSIPGILLIAASVLILEVFMNQHAQWFTSTAARADARLFALCVILGLTSWTSLCRLIRAETLKLREQDYVLAAQALGVKHLMIILKHIFPNLLHIILITIVLDFSGLVLAEAVLSYIGVGVDPSMQSFGNMINSARLELAREPTVWWPLAAAFIFMFILVLAANLFADTVRDALDPHKAR